MAIIALNIANELNLSDIEKNNIVLVALFHDIGALSLNERLEALKFEFDFIQKTPKHPEYSYRLLKIFKPFRKAAKIIKYHHHMWADAKQLDIKKCSQVLHLADRIGILISRDKPILSQKESIRKKIIEHTPQLFNPAIVEGLKNLCSKGQFWLDIINKLQHSIIRGNLDSFRIEFDLKGLSKFARMLSSMIDFKSRYTATHSSGVSAVAEKIAQLTEGEQKVIRVSGFLHDLGKLVIPSELLEKGGR